MFDGINGIFLAGLWRLVGGGIFSRINVINRIGLKKNRQCPNFPSF